MIGPESLAFPRAEWMSRASCIDEDVSTFFPEFATGAELHRRTQKVRRICAVCVVREECLRYAVDNAIYPGWWGGLSPKERRVYERRRAS